jgi:GT2 family glycosyltransferase
MGRPFFTANNLAVRRELYLRVGGFNEQLHWAHEDREFADRWREQGLELGYAAEALVRHVHDFDLKSFCRHQFNYGTTSRSHAAAARAPQGQHRSRFPGVGYYLRMLQYPFLRLEWKRAAVMSGLFALAQVCYLSGIGWSMTQKQAYKPTYRTSRPPSA